MYCNRCGKKNPDGMRFCSFCGHLMETNTAMLNNPQNNSGSPHTDYYANNASDMIKDKETNINRSTSTKVIMALIGAVVGIMVIIAVFAIFNRRPIKPQVVDADQFADYLNNELGVEQLEDLGSPTDLLDGYYVDSAWSSNYLKSGRIFNGVLNQGFQCSMLNRLLNSIEETYSPTRVVCCFQGRYDNSKTQDYSDGSFSYYTTIYHLTYNDPSEATEMFKNFTGEIDTHLETYYRHDYEKFEDYFYNGNHDRGAGKPGYICKCWNPDAVVNPCNMVPLNRLPGEVYKFDEKSHTGNLSFMIEDRWCNVGDVLQVQALQENGLPSQIRVSKNRSCFSIELRDNTIIILIAKYGFAATTINVYFDEWPNPSIDDDHTIVSLCRKFGLSDPYRTGVQKENVNRELQYLFNGAHNNPLQEIHCQEIYLRKND